MYSSYISKTFIRGLRGQKKSAAAGFLKNGNTQAITTLLSEDDLSLLKTKQTQEDKSYDCPIIDVITYKHKTDVTPPFLQKEPKKEFFRNLKAFSLKYPLQYAITVENQFEQLAHAATPLHQAGFSYQKQLAIKQRHAEGELNSLRRKLKSAEAFLTYMTPTRAGQVKLPCPVENIVASPEVLNYRNMDEFSVHVGADGDPKTVGFFVGNHGDPLSRCIPPTELATIKESHKLVAKHFRTFIRNSPRKTCLTAGEGGLWRKIIVRSSRDEILMAVTVNSNELSETMKNALKEDLSQYFFSGLGSECQLTSLLLQACPWRSCPRQKAPYELIRGQPYLTEECLGVKLRLYSDSLFEANTRAAELFYHSIVKMIPNASGATLFDVCCGSGLLSLFLAPRFSNVIGIDPYFSAVEDAKTNARDNGIEGVDFFCGNTKTLVLDLTKELESTSEVVALLYPSRKQLDSSVFKAFRDCKSVKKIIYIASEFNESVKHKLTFLCATLKECYWGPKAERKDIIVAEQGMLTDPFVLKYSIPVDLYPQTCHVHYIFLFERANSWLRD